MTKRLEVTTGRERGRKGGRNRKKGRKGEKLTRGREKEGRDLGRGNWVKVVVVTIQTRLEVKENLTDYSGDNGN